MADIHNCLTLIDAKVAAAHKLFSDKHGFVPGIFKALTGRLAYPD